MKRDRQSRDKRRTRPSSHPPTWAHFTTTLQLQPDSAQVGGHLDMNLALITTQPLSPSTIDKQHPEWIHSQHSTPCPCCTLSPRHVHPSLYVLTVYVIEVT